MMTIDEICDLLARELPEGYAAKLKIEDGRVSMTADNGRWYCRPGGISIEDQLLAALRVCKEHAEKNP